MRGRKTLINTAANLIEQLIAIVCGFILPRLILAYFGSRYNGLTTSITQFLSCAVLLRSGIGGATRAALYKPLAEKNKEEIDSIVKATDLFMKKIGLILAIMIVVFAVIHPFFVLKEFDWFFTFSLFIIIGASTFAESFFGITYLIVLQADQRIWVSSVLKSICYILNVIISAVLIINGSSIHIVKLGSAVVYVLYPIVLAQYVKKHYCINRNAKPNNKAISQRWDAFWQQVAIFVMGNTDVIVLTIFSNMLEVSVYSVYNLVNSGLKNLITSISNGLEAPFGNMIAKEEYNLLKENVSIIETIMYTIATIIYTSALILILDFVKIYTNGLTDVNYIRPVFAYVLIVAQFFNGIRIPYQLVVQAAGHYKQTKTGAIIEPILNLSISVVLVFRFGLIGVAIGTLVATIFRTIQYCVYMNKNIVHGKNAMLVLRTAISIFEATVCILFFNFAFKYIPSGYFDWAIKGIVVCLFCCVITLSVNFCLYKKDFQQLFVKLKAMRRVKTNEY